MEIDRYQAKAREFAVYPDIGENITYPALGLAGEAGEFANQVKKVLRDDKGEITVERGVNMMDELGDVLWYVANAASELGFSLDDVAEFNLRKLTYRRYADSIHGDRRA